MKNVKCHVFRWSTNCYDCSPHHYYDFEADFREIVCPYLSKYLTTDDMAECVDTTNYDENGKADFWLLVPIEHYDDKEFEKISDKVDSLADEHFGGWEFTQEDDDEIALDLAGE